MWRGPKYGALLLAALNADFLRFVGPEDDTWPYLVSGTVYRPKESSFYKRPIGVPFGGPFIPREAEPVASLR